MIAIAGAALVDFSEKQIAPPTSWETFEDLCLALFKQIWANPLALKHGRKGQPQHGVDVYGAVDPDGVVLHGVQCKGKNKNYNSKPTIPELKAEIAKAEKFKPSLRQWIFATTAPPDAKLQEAARKISAQRKKKGKFVIHVLAWDDIQRLIADYPSVLKKFYPEHSQDLEAIIRRLELIAASISVREILGTEVQFGSAGALHQPTTTSPAWMTVKFSPKRDLKPALMGRPLGAADAMACPTLPEEQSLIAELGKAYFVRLVGEAGAGKSICAYQTAHHFAQLGWRVLELADPSAFGEGIEWTKTKTLYLIDDAHLIPSWILGRAESQANENTLLLSTINAQSRAAARPGSIVLDKQRAVRTIATALRKNLKQTLQIVKAVDDRVSDDPMSEDLAYRLDNAEMTADRPWQFCFILGGGWRRASLAADNARAVNADHILAIAGLRQIASRDERCTRKMLDSLLDSAGVEKRGRDAALGWLVTQRLLVSEDDLRTPHQRFAAILIPAVLKGQSENIRNQIWQAVRIIFQDDNFPLVGLRVLRNELQFNGGIYWAPRIQPEWLEHLYQRCWKTTDATLPTAISLIGEIATGMMLKRSITKRRKQVISWLSSPTNQTGHALSRLLHALGEEQKDFGQRLVSDVDAKSAARIVSEVTSNSAFQLGSYLEAVWRFADQSWRKKFRAGIERDALIALAKSWPDDQYISSFSEFARATYWMDRELGLDVVEAFIPAFTRAVHRDPADAIHEFDDVLWHVIKGNDLLGLYQTKNKQAQREKAICRRICEKWNITVVAAKISAMTKRQFQSAAWLLNFAAHSKRNAYEAICESLDWTAIEQTIGDGWLKPFHGMDQFLAVSSHHPKSGREIARLIGKHLKDAPKLPGRLAILAPGQVRKHLKAGRLVAVGSDQQIDWYATTRVLAELLPKEVQLAQRLVSPLLKPISQFLSKSDPSFWADSHIFFHLLRQCVPNSLEEILNEVQPATAMEQWQKGLIAREEVRRPTALLIDIAKDRNDELGRMARGLKDAYPTKSRPVKSDLEPFSESD